MARKLRSAAAATSTPRTIGRPPGPRGRRLPGTRGLGHRARAAATGRPPRREDSSPSRRPCGPGGRVVGDVDGRLGRRLGHDRLGTGSGSVSRGGSVAGSPTELPARARARLWLRLGRLWSGSVTGVGSDWSRGAVTGSAHSSREDAARQARPTAASRRGRFGDRLQHGLRHHDRGCGGRFEARRRERAGEHGRELGRGGRTVRRVLGHRLADRVGDGRGDPAVAQVGHLDVADPVEHREDVGVPAVDERRLPGEHGVDGGTEGVDVPGRRGLATGEGLRRTVGPRDHVGARRVDGDRGVDQPGHPEVGQQRLVELGEQDVGRLDVAVEDPVLVDVLERRGEGAGQPDGLRPR